MDFSPLHPKIVHIPLALAIILPLLNLSLLLSWWKRWLPRRVWIISACLHALMTFTAFVAMQTGETDEHTAERVVSEHKIHEHEEAAELFLWVSVIALLLALVAAIADQEKLGLKYALATTVLAFLCAFLAVEAGYHGGELVYKYGAGRAFSPDKYGGVSDLPVADDPHHDSDVKVDERH